MDVSIIVPTRDRAGHVEAFLRCLCAQEGGARTEVLIGFDGADAESAGVCERIARESDGIVIRGITYERCGVGGVKNRLLGEARGETLLFLNDDVRPEVDFVARHVAAQRELKGRLGRGAMVLGDSPWAVRAPDRLFDRLIRETSMVFFYDQMRGADPESDHDWGFRHAWNLNLSVPRAAVEAAGGFYRDPTNRYGYEDLELAWRLQRMFEMPVVYRPRARATHEHWYEPSGYLERERRLGHAAFGFARAAPECARDVFGRDVTSEEEAAYSRAFVQREAGAAERLRASFLGLAELPAEVVDGAHGERVMRLLYEQHLLLKRYEWRRGLLAAAAGMDVEDAASLEVSGAGAGSM